MITLEVINYVKQQIAQGVSRSKILVSLKQSGWDDGDIIEIFSAFDNLTNSTSQASRTIHSHKTRNFFIAFFVVFSMGLFGWWLVKSQTHLVVKNEISNIDNDVEVSTNENLGDLKISYVPVEASENSVSVFASIKENAISKEDSDFLAKFLSDNQTAVRPITESKKILSKYSKLLKIFESGVEKKYYQCSVAMGDTCNLNNLRSVSRLATVSSFVLWKDGKTDEAKEYAQKIIKLGKMLTEQTDDIITLLVGWEIQKIGYYAVKDAGGVELSLDIKKNLIKNLREEQKKLWRLDYLRILEIVDYTTDVNNKPSFLIKETKEIMDEFRKAINDTTWKPDVVKKWFTDSLAVELSNIDLPCGSQYKNSKIDVGFNPEDKPQTENFVGKTLYYTNHVSLSNTNLKRCEIENLINAL